MGLNPRIFHLNQQNLTGAELTTWVVSEAYRGCKIGQKILGKIKENYDVLLGTGITSQALPLYMNNGFRFLKSLPRFLKIINFENIRPYTQFNQLGERLVTQFYPTTFHHYHTTKIHHIDDMNYIPKINLYHFSREKEDLAWRYFHHPIFDYHCFNIQSHNKHQALVILRIENCMTGFKIAHIMDILAAHPDAYLASLSFLNDFSAQNNIDIMDFYCTSSNTTKYLLANGWFSILDDECIQFPHLFHPLELRTPPTTSLIYWAKKQSDFQELCDFGKLYITKQDCDLDRPTALTYQENKA